MTTAPELSGHRSHDRAGPLRPDPRLGNRHSAQRNRNMDAMREHKKNHLPSTPARLLGLCFRGATLRAWRLAPRLSHPSAKKTLLPCVPLASQFVRRTLGASSLKKHRWLGVSECTPSTTFGHGPRMAIFSDLPVLVFRQDMSRRRNGLLGRREEIPNATKLESFAPTIKCVSTDREGTTLSSEFGRSLSSVQASYCRRRKTGKTTEIPMA